MMLTHKQKWKQTPTIVHSKSTNDIEDSTWRDVYSDEESDEDEFKQYYMKRGANTNSLNNSFEPIPLQKAVSFESIVHVVLIPQTKEYDHMRDILWYTDEELHEFVTREIEIRKKERENQQKELKNMRNEEIYTIMMS